MSDTPPRYFLRGEDITDRVVREQLPEIVGDPRPLSRVKDPDALKRFRLENLGEPCEICERRTGAHAHHITFRSQGGDDASYNLLWLCPACHDDIHAGRVDRYRFG